MRTSNTRGVGPVVLLAFFVVLGLAIAFLLRHEPARNPSVEEMLAEFGQAVV